MKFCSICGAEEEPDDFNPDWTPGCCGISMGGDHAETETYSNDWAARCSRVEAELEAMKTNEDTVRKVCRADVEMHQKRAYEAEAMLAEAKRLIEGTLADNKRRIDAVEQKNHEIIEEIAKQLEPVDMQSDKVARGRVASALMPPMPPAHAEPEAWKARRAAREAAITEANRGPKTPTGLEDGLWDGIQLLDAALTSPAGRAHPTGAEMLRCLDSLRALLNAHPPEPTQSVHPYRPGGAEAMTRTALNEVGLCGAICGNEACILLLDHVGKHGFQF